MKRIKTTTKQVAVFQKPSLERPDSGTAVMRKTRDQLIDELATTVCESTGTHNDDVAYRIVCQAASAQVWPKPVDESGHSAHKGDDATECNGSHVGRANDSDQ